MEHAQNIASGISHHIPWNKGRIIGPKPPLKLKEIWAIRIRLQLARNIRDLALFNLAIDSKLRGCDLVKLQVRDVAHAGKVVSRATILQQKTGQLVRFELTEQTREALEAWIADAKLTGNQFLFPSRVTHSPHISTRQYARIVKRWMFLAGLAPEDYGSHTLRRTKATLIYRRTKNLRAVQLLLGHTKLESTVRYLGIEVDDALEMAEQTEV
jgi:integrase